MCYITVSNAKKAKQKAESHLEKQLNNKMILKKWYSIICIIIYSCFDCWRSDCNFFVSLGDYYSTQLAEC